MWLKSGPRKNEMNPSAQYVHTSARVLHSTRLHTLNKHTSSHRAATHTTSRMRASTQFHVPSTAAAFKYIRGWSGSRRPRSVRPKSAAANKQQTTTSSHIGVCISPCTNQLVVCSVVSESISNILRYTALKLLGWLPASAAGNRIGDSRTPARAGYSCTKQIGTQRRA